MWVFKDFCVHFFPCLCPQLCNTGKGPIHASRSQGTRLYTCMHKTIRWMWRTEVSFQIAVFSSTFTHRFCILEVAVVIREGQLLQWVRATNRNTLNYHQSEFSLIPISSPAPVYLTFDPSEWGIWIKNDIWSICGCRRKTGDEANLILRGESSIMNTLHALLMSTASQWLSPAMQWVSGIWDLHVCDNACWLPTYYWLSPTQSVSTVLITESL